MKLGVLVETEEGLDWAAWRGVCAAAERLGFDSVWASDHFASPWAAERHGLDAWVALAVAAAETRRLRLGTLVSPIMFRPPALVGRMAEAIDALAAGRFVLGLGLGWNADEHRAAGVEFPPVAARRQRLSDGITCIRDVLGERRIPVLIGGSGPRSTLPIVARCADEWNMTTASVEAYRASSALLAEECLAVGRRPESIRRSVAAGVLVGRSVDELRQRSRTMQQRVAPLARVAVDDVVLAARAQGWVAGTPPEIVAALRRLAAAGVELAILGHYDPADQDALELLASDVLPALA